jgi:signal transduction histidine kinase
MSGHDAPPPGDDIAEQLREALRFLSHDAREGHSSALALLELQRVRADSMQGGELAQRIERNARRSLTRIDDFVAFARARLQPLASEEFDLPDLLFDAVAEAWQAGNERGVRLKVGDAPPEGVLHTDKPLLRAAIVRLLQHALEHSRRGSDLVCSLREMPQAWSIEIDETRAADVAGQHIEASEPVSESQYGWALVELVASRLGGAVRRSDEPEKGVRLRVTLPRD